MRRPASILAALALAAGALLTVPARASAAPRPDPGNLRGAWAIVDDLEAWFWNAFGGKDRGATTAEQSGSTIPDPGITKPSAPEGGDTGPYIEPNG